MTEEEIRKNERLATLKDVIDELCRQEWVNGLLGDEGAKITIIGLKKYLVFNLKKLEERE